MDGRLQDAQPDFADESGDDDQRKIRKPYTITKSRESWTDNEHAKFLEALELYGRDWKNIEAYVGSKTVIQIRSHAQKYFLKMQKSGGQYPPPRPKRKSAHPYPQKAATSKKAVARSTNFPVQSNVDTKSTTSPQVANMSIPTPLQQAGSSSDSSQRSSQEEIPEISFPGVSPSASNATDVTIASVSDTSASANEGTVCKFLASVFDPGASDHLARLRTLAPQDREAVLARLGSLCSTLASEGSLELVRHLREGQASVPEQLASSDLLLHNLLATRPSFPCILSSAC